DKARTDSLGADLVRGSASSRASRREERPGDEHGLEEEAAEALGVRVEAESIALMDPLREVDWADQHEEGSGKASDYSSPPARRGDERRTEGNLSDARCDDRRVGIERHEIGDLRAELAPRGRDMRDAREGERGSECDAGDGARS